jgi:DNA-binding MarR family transcriptional regulator
MTENQGSRSAQPANSVDAVVQLAKATWPQIDADVEGIVVRISRAADRLDRAARASLQRVALTKEEFKVLCLLHGGSRSHGSLCDELGVSTGAMTNRLDKLERAGLVERTRDSRDRRGVLLDLTPVGQSKLDDYIDLGTTQEQTLLSGLNAADKHKLNQLMEKLLTSLNADLKE